MSIQTSANALRIEQLKVHLRAEQYSASVQRWYPALVGHFLGYLESKAVTVETVRASDLDSFLRRQHRIFRKRHAVAAPLAKWRQRYTGALHMLLRLVHGRWPVPVEPTTALEAFHRDIVQEYDAWLRDLRGLLPVTRSKRTKQAQLFLTALGPNGNQDRLRRLGVPDVDAYVEQRCTGLRRASIEDCTVCLRDFLSHLYRSGRAASDLSRTVIGPRIYEYEQIPSALPPEHVEKVLEVTRQDRSPTGLRDYALLMLLATYGLRAAEIVTLRMEDIDWKMEVLRVRHSKTGTHSELPLLREPGEAVLRYLKKARPKSIHREVFLRIHAPHRPFKNGSILNCVTGARLKAAGIIPLGRKGPHAFRHARAVSLLRATVPLKIIGDVLGHTSARSTGVYLKLATQDLRAIGLDLPSGVSP
jgi:integrase/recombinase XerD